MAISAIKRRAEQIPDDELRKQALASIAEKTFHCQGGAVYALLHRAKLDALIPLIVSFQTISDYLDNLCDRSVSLDPVDFRLLHQAMLDAILPGAPVRDYYASRGHLDDGGYLQHLVQTCQQTLAQFPHLESIRPTLEKWVGLYIDLQVYKHIEKSEREQALLAWWDLHRHAYPNLQWQEFAAATGSTLAMFMCFVVASEESFDAGQFDNQMTAYFPYVCGLHILLDYFIDQDEDKRGGDLNFCSYYEGREQLFWRLTWFAEQAKLCVSYLPNSRFHGIILEGLFALYLSDEKVNRQPDVERMMRNWMADASLARRFLWMNSKWIRKIYKK
jgi:tetraprenyl-beta-curcumene synthase